MADSSSSSQHQSQHIGYRIFIHRLNLDGYSVPAPYGSTIPLSSVMKMDFADHNYPEISDWFNKQENFQELLRTLKQAVDEGLAKGPAFISKGSGLLKTIDISPLVTSYAVELHVDSENSATINMVDMAFQDSSRNHIKNWAAQVPQTSDGSSSAFDVSSADILSSLTGLSIREFDLVRIMAYSAFSKDSAGIPNENRIDLASRLEWFSNSDTTLDPYYAMTPQFTGVVSSVTRTAALGGTPSIAIHCLGMSRIFTQSVVVADQAIANVFSGPAGAPELGEALGHMNTLGNVFQGKTSESAFQKLISDYLHPKYVKENVGAEEPTVVLGIPTIEQSYWDDLMANKVVTKPAGTLSLIPFMPLAVLYHILKSLRAEPIVVMDDYLDKKTNFAGDSPERTPSSYSDNLSPYLTMVKTAYQIYDASYMSPQDVFGEIRSQTYYEIFEDRTGAMHMRLPRYNSRLVKQVCNPDNTISAAWSKDDSANFNVTLSQNMMAYVGKIQGIAGNPYLDRLSIIKSGFRVPAIVENPNAVNIDFSKALGRFMRDYNASKNSRKAVVKRLLDLSANVGQQVIFELGPTDKISSGDLTLISGEDDLFVGYITSMSESVSVSGQNEQTLNLSFVRPVHGIGTQPIVDELAYGIYELASLIAVNSKNDQSAIVSQMSDIVVAYESGSNLSSSSKYVGVTKVSAGKSGWYYITARDVADPITLAKKSHAVPLDPINASLSPGKKTKTSPSEIRARIRGLNRQASERAMFLARNVKKSEVYSSVLKSMGEYPVLGHVAKAGLVTGSGASFPSKPEDILFAGNMFRDYVKKAVGGAFSSVSSLGQFAQAHETVLGALALLSSVPGLGGAAESIVNPSNNGSVAPVVLDFGKNDPLSPRTIKVDNGSLGISPLTIIKEGLIQIEADQQDDTIAVYKAKIDPGQAPGHDYDSVDVNDVVGVFDDIKDMLSSLIEQNNKKAAQEDETMQSILIEIKNLSAKLGNPSTTATTKGDNVAGYSVNSSTTTANTTMLPSQGLGG
jgi:hypothetical protein